MSGGVDSATAAARAVDAGHEVTGVHLALSSNPSSYRTGARGCCTLEDARDARRAADVIGIPFYVWDMAERFHRDVVEDFVAEYAAGRTPNPCLRCNEKIKFAAVLDRALALGFNAVCTGHYARISDGMLQRAVDPGKDQSYVLAVLTSDQLAHSMFPLGDTPKAQVRAEAAQRGLAVADKPDSHDVCFIADGDTKGFPGPPPGPGARPDRRHLRRCPRRAPGRLRFHRRPAPGPARRHARWRRQAPLRARHRAGDPDGHGGHRRRPRHQRDHRGPPGLDGVRAADGTRTTVSSSSARTATCTPARPGWTETRCASACAVPRAGVAKGQAAVLYDGDTVLGSATISGTLAAAPLARIPVASA